mgnify:FL=1
MKKLVPAFIILTVLATSELWHGQARNLDRRPASLWAGCMQAFRIVSSVAKSPWLGFLRRVPRPNLKQFSVDEVGSATARYIEELNSGKSLDEIVPESMEETLGLMEAVLVTRGFDAVDYAAMDRLKRGKIASLLKQLDKPSRFSLEAYENIWAEIFVARLGRWERYKSIFDGEHAKAQAIQLLMQEEIARLGLVKAGRKYALLENPENSVRRFTNSSLGKSLSTSIFNLPIAFGMPPLAIPKLNRLRLPQDLADSLLKDGLSEANLARVDEFLVEYSAGRFGLNLGVRERYELIRKTYSAGLGIYFLILGSWEAVVRYRELSEEEDAISDGIHEISQILEQAANLEQQGYQIFEDGPTTSTVSRECRDLKDCLRSSAGEGPWETQSQVYLDCKSFVDPDNKCKSLNE